MLRRICAAFAVAALVTLAAVPSRAQHDTYLNPVEQAFLDSHVDLQFYFSRYEMTVLRQDMGINIIILSLEGQYALADRLEVGLNLPVVQHAEASVGRFSDEDTFFGDIVVNLKGKLFGTDDFALSLFGNTALPTHSYDEDPDDPVGRNYARLHMGASATATVQKAILGGNLVSLWGINGNGQEDTALLGFECYGGFEVDTQLVLRMAIQFLNSVHPNSDLNVLAFTPGVEVRVVPNVHIGLASRIAANDDAKLFNGGRASFMFNGGYSF